MHRETKPCSPDLGAKFISASVPSVSLCPLWLILRKWATGVFLARFLLLIQSGANADNREGAKGAKEIQSSCTQSVASDRII